MALTDKGKGRDILKAKNNNKSCSSPHSLAMDFLFVRDGRPLFNHRGAVTCFWGGIWYQQEIEQTNSIIHGCSIQHRILRQNIVIFTNIPPNLQIHPTNQQTSNSSSTILPVQGLSHISKMLMALMWYKTLLQWHHLDWKVAIVKKVNRSNLTRNFRSVVVIQKCSCRYQSE